MTDLSPTKELFLETLEVTGGDLTETCVIMDISKSYGYSLQASLSEEIIQRARNTLAVAALQAAQVVISSLTLDASEEKAELHLKAAEGILDRTGVTKHTNVDVKVEADNGIFILPGKASVEPDGETEDDS